MTGRARSLGYPQYSAPRSTMQTIIYSPGYLTYSAQYPIMGGRCPLNRVGGTTLSEDKPMNVKPGEMIDSRTLETVAVQCHNCHGEHMLHEYELTGQEQPFATEIGSQRMILTGLVMVLFCPDCKAPISAWVLTP